MAVERAQLEVASPSEDDVRAADRLPSTPPPPPPSLHCLHPSPVLYCESQRQPGRVSTVCVCVCLCARCVCVCVCGCRSAPVRRRRREVVSRPPPTSPPLCICPSQFEQRVFFACLPLLFLLSSSTHSLIQKERARKRKSKKERKRERYTAIPSQRAQLFCYSGVNQVDAYCCRYRFVCAFVCVCEAE